MPKRLCLFVFESYLDVPSITQRGVFYATKMSDMYVTEKISLCSVGGHAGNDGRGCNKKHIRKEGHDGTRGILPAIVENKNHRATTCLLIMYRILCAPWQQLVR